MLWTSPKSTLPNFSPSLKPFGQGCNQGRGWGHRPQSKIVCLRLQGKFILCNRGVYMRPILLPQKFDSPLTVLSYSYSLSFSSHSGEKMKLKICAFVNFMELWKIINYPARFLFIWSKFLFFSSSRWCLKPSLPTRSSYINDFRTRK